MTSQYLVRWLRLSKNDVNQDDVKLLENWEILCSKIVWFKVSKAFEKS